MLNSSTNLWDRLLEVLEADNLDQAAEKLGLNASTLRGRKARDAVPYDEIVQKLDAQELAYVFKNEKLNKDTQDRQGGIRTLKFRMKDDPDNPIKVWSEYEDVEKPAEANDVNDLRYELSKSAFEDFVTGLTHRIEESPFSKEAKLQIIDSVIRIVEKDLRQVQKERSQTDPDPDANQSS